MKAMQSLTGLARGPLPSASQQGRSTPPARCPTTPPHIPNPVESRTILTPFRFPRGHPGQRRLLHPRNMEARQTPQNAQAVETIRRQITAPAAFLEAGKRNAFDQAAQGTASAPRPSETATHAECSPSKASRSVEPTAATAYSPGRESFSQPAEPQPSKPPAPRQSKAGPRQSHRSHQPPNLHAGNQWTRIRLARAWGTPVWIAVVRQCQTRDRPGRNN